MSKAVVIANEHEQVDDPRIPQPVLDSLEGGIGNAMLLQQLQGKLDNTRILGASLTVWMMPFCEANVRSFVSP